MAKEWVRRVVSGEKVLERKFPSISITNKYILSNGSKPSGVLVAPTSVIFKIKNKK